jgi:hypothetical protein
LKKGISSSKKIAPNQAAVRLSAILRWFLSIKKKLKKKKEKFGSKIKALTFALPIKKGAQK